MEDSTGREGYSISDETNPDLAERWEAEVVTNFATAAREAFMETDKGKALTPGQSVLMHLWTDEDIAEQNAERKRLRQQQHPPNNDLEVHRE